MSVAQISTRGDYDNFNLTRYLMGMKAKLETGRDPKDFLGPDSFEYGVYTRKAAQSELNGQDGGFLAPEEWSSVFHDVIRDNSVFRTLPVVRTMTNYRIHHMAVGMSEWGINYVGDNTALTSADRKVAMRTLTMHKATALATIPNELLRDAGDLANQWLLQSAGEMVAFEEDRQSLIGNGLAGTPIGLLNMSNVPQTSMAGAAPTLAQLSTMIYNAKSLNQSSNVPAGSTTDVAVVAHPRLENTIRAMINVANQSTSPWLFGLGTEPISRFLGVDWVLTASVPITFTNIQVPTGGSQTQIFAGDWRRLRVTTRGDFEFIITPLPGTASTGFQADQSLVRVVFRYDVSATHPEAFNILTNAIQ